MRIAITGTTGRVGKALLTHLSRRHEVVALPRDQFDLANREQVHQVLEDLYCDVFLHPAGMTSLEACEDQPARAMRVNADAAADIADWAAAAHARMVYFSTDYVFPGKRAGFRFEDDPTQPLSVYGRSKLAGERAVLAASPRNAVVRVSWVFGPEKPSFVDGVWQALERGDPLNAVADKTSLPTFTHDLVAWIETILAAEAHGIIHACQSGEPATWYEIAQLVADEFVAQRGGVAAKIHPQRMDEVVHFRAPRPRHTAMATGRLASLLNAPPRGWREALTEYLQSPTFGR